MKKNRFRIYFDNRVNEIDYLLEIIINDPDNSKYTIFSEIYDKSKPNNYILIYLDTPNTTSEDLDAKIVKHEYVKLVSLYFVPTKNVSEFLYDKFKFDYDTIVSYIKLELLDAIKDFDLMYKNGAKNNILFITLYNCFGSMQDFKELSQAVSKDLSSLLLNGRSIRIVGTIPLLFKKK